MNWKVIIWLLLVLVVESCDNQKSKLRELLNREIVFGDYLEPIAHIGDLTFDDAIASEFKILIIFQENECLPCNIIANNPSDIVNGIKNITDIEIPVFFILEHPSMEEVSTVAENYRNNYIFHDKKRLFCLSNSIPNNKDFRYLLLNSSNKILLIGNPVQNPKIKDLYIRTICERLGIERTAEGMEKQQTSVSYDFGKFPYTETKETEFLLSNKSDTKMLIDTIYTSCDCTTATIDKTTIEPGTSTCVSVSFKTDKPETFTRDIYVKTGEKTHVFSIRGEAL